MSPTALANMAKQLQRNQDDLRNALWAEGSERIRVMTSEVIGVLARAEALVLELKIEC